MVVETRGSLGAPNSDPKPLLHLITNTYLMERGPRYDAYSKLRESKIRMRFAIPEEEDDLPIRGDESPVIGVPRPETTPSPIKKSVRFQGGGQVLQSLKRKGPTSGMVAQSVPDFSRVLRKENRRPPPANRVEKSVTPPARKPSKVFGSGSKLGMGSKSVNSGEKRGVGVGVGVGVGDGGFGLVGRTTTGMAARRSYAIDELKGLSAVAAAAITGESRGVGGGRRVVGRTSVMGLRQYY